MDIHRKSVDMDMDVKFHIHGNPGPTAINNVRYKSITAVVYLNSQCASTVPSALADLLVDKPEVIH